MDDMWKYLSKARLEQSLQCLKSARILLEHEDYRGAANRSYYAIFHAMRSVLALDNKDFSKHAGVISCFRKDYLKTGELPRDLSPIITLAFEVRSDCDYDDYCLENFCQSLESLGFIRVQDSWFSRSGCNI